MIAELHRPSILALFCAITSLVACKSDLPIAPPLVDGGADGGPPVPRVTGLPRLAAANAVPPEHALFEGQQRFLYDAWGTERLDSWPPASFMLELMTREPSVFGDQYASFGFVGDPDDDFPVGFKRGLEDPSRVRETCALCHVGRLPDGALWLGLPNTRLDFARFRNEVSTRWEAAGNPPLVSAMEREKNALLGPGRTSAEDATNPRLVAADFPLYFDLGARTHLNYLGTGGDLRTEAYLSIFSTGAGDPLASGGAVAFPAPARVDPFLAFLGSMRPPPAPSVDPTVRAAGRAVFERARCGDCHHTSDIAADGIVTYDKAVEGRERLPGEDDAFPRGSIRTSYVHRILVDGEEGLGPDVDDRVLALLRFIGTNNLDAGPSDGYRVADLRSLWITAPYLHNGSVPTLEALLLPPAERPTRFMRDGFEIDTTLPSNSNEGHAFGTTLSAEERASLVAYLRSE